MQSITQKKLAIFCEHYELAKKEANFIACKWLQGYSVSADAMNEMVSSISYVVMIYAEWIKTLKCYNEIWTDS